MRLTVNASRPRVVDFYSQVLERVRALPGVSRSGIVEDVWQRRNADYRVVAEGGAVAPAGALSGDAASPGFFGTIGVRLLRGRVFSDRDVAGAPPVAVINNSMAVRFWPGQDPIGKRFRATDAKADDPWCSVIGVVADMRREGLERQPIAQVFWPHAQRPVATVDLVLRTVGDPARLASTVREEIRAIDRRVPVFQIATLDELLDASISTRRFQSLLLTLLSTIALALAAIGVYGLMHYAVAQRTHEIGIRMALGARGSDVLGLVVREGASAALIGLIAGMAGSLWLTRLLATLLVGVTPTDPLTLAVVPALASAIAVLACCVPARRAMRIDPLIALRSE